MSLLPPPPHLFPLCAIAAQAPDGWPEEYALIQGVPHRRRRGPAPLERWLQRVDPTLSWLRDHPSRLAQTTLLVGVLAWWLPRPLPGLIGLVLGAVWAYHGLERSARRWAQWEPVDWTPALQRAAARYPWLPTSWTGPHVGGEAMRGGAMGDPAMAHGLPSALDAMLDLPPATRGARVRDARPSANPDGRPHPPR